MTDENTTSKKISKLVKSSTVPLFHVAVTVNAEFLTSGCAAHVSFGIFAFLLKGCYNVIIIIFYYSLTLKKKPKLKESIQSQAYTYNRPVVDLEGKAGKGSEQRRKTEKILTSNAKMKAFFNFNS